MYIYIFIYNYLFMYIYIHIHTHTYIHIYTYTHILCGGYPNPPAAPRLAVQSVPFPNRSIRKGLRMTQFMSQLQRSHHNYGFREFA